MSCHNKLLDSCLVINFSHSWLISCLLESDDQFLFEALGSYFYHEAAGIESKWWNQNDSSREAVGFLYFFRRALFCVRSMKRTNWTWSNAKFNAINLVAKHLILLQFLIQIFFSKEDYYLLTESDTDNSTL